MSLVLVQGTKPENLEIKTFGFGNSEVHLGDYSISIVDFLEASLYVLTNTDLAPDDPRREFVRQVSQLKEVEGYNPHRKRSTLLIAFEPIFW